MENASKQSKEAYQRKQKDQNAPKVPPQALDCEEAVLGGLLIEPSAFFEVASILKKECFYDEKNKLVFEAMAELSNNNSPIDYYTVSEQMKRDGTLEKVGGIGFLLDLSGKTSTAVNIESHAAIVAQKYLAREMIRVTSDIQENAFNPQTDVKDLIADAERELFQVTQANVRQEATHINEVLSDVIEKIEKAHNSGGKCTGIPSGFGDLDRIVYGWQPGTLNVVAARPAMGKTAFALSMARNMAVDNNYNVCIFSLEMSTQEISSRLLCNVSEINGESIKRGDLAPHEWESLQKNASKLSKANIYIDDTPGLSIFELCSKARKMKRTENIDCIIIDYLQMLSAPVKSSATREQEVSFVSRTLKALAKELNIPIIALAQLNRGVEARSSEEKRPQLADLRESGAIEQDADVVLMLHRPEYYHITQDSNGNDLRGLAMLIIAKHRSGVVGDIWLRFESRFIRFTNLPDREKPKACASNILDTKKESPVKKLEVEVPEKDNEPPF